MFTRTQPFIFHSDLRLGPIECNFTVYKNYGWSAFRLYDFQLRKYIRRISSLFSQKQVDAKLL